MHVSMKTFYFFVCCIVGFLATISAKEPEKPDCLEKEKALTLLETAENLLTKAKDYFPSCKEDINSTVESECVKKKSLAYIEVSKKLISDVRKNFPKCTIPIEKDDKIVKEEKHRDCSEILSSGRNESGIYTIWIGNASAKEKRLRVFCDMKTDNQGWTVIQRRGNFSGFRQDFYLDWESYKNGFGNLTKEFWLGNENIRLLCLEGCQIRFDLKAKNGATGFAHYQNFHLSGSDYRLNISHYTGNAADDMQNHNGLSFSTKDKGATDRALKFKGAWWYRPQGYYCNLNGFYQHGKSNYETVHWYSFRKEENLNSVEIKVRRK